MNTLPSSGLPPSTTPPPIIVSNRDFNRLEQLLDSPGLRRHPAAVALMDELNRAEVLPPEQMPPNVVTMNSTVQFSIVETGKELRLTLVYPRDLDGSADKVSIFAPVGSALLGLSVGDELAWPGPGGKAMTVRVTDILFQPERAGELHR